MKRYTKRLLIVISLFSVNISLLSAGYFIAPQSTNQNEYPNIGNAIYRNLDNWQGIPITHVGHAAIFYEYKNGKRRVIQANGSCPSSDTSWEMFGASDGYWGAYTQERMIDASGIGMDSALTKRLIDIAFNMCRNKTYAVCWGHYKDPWGVGGTPALRCDGLVEYCYERAFDGEWNIPPYTAPNQGIVPDDYSGGWHPPYTVADCPVHTFRHNMVPTLQMEWINEASMYNDEHDWADNWREGRNSVPNISILDSVLVFSIGGKKGEYKEIEGPIVEKAEESVQGNKIPFARFINSNWQKLTYKEFNLNNSKSYKKITLNKTIEKGKKDYLAFSNNFEPLSKVGSSSSTARWKGETNSILPVDKNKFFASIQNDNKSSKNVILGPESFEGSATGWSQFSGPDNASSNVWYFLNSGIPGSGYDGTYVIWINYDASNPQDKILQTPAMNFSCFTGCTLAFRLWQSSSYEDVLYIGVSSEGGQSGTWVWKKSFYQTGSNWSKQSVDLSAYDGQSNIVIGFCYYAQYPGSCNSIGIDYVTVTGEYTGNSGDTTQNLRITNNGLAPLKISNIYPDPAVTWIKGITPNPSSLPLIFPGDTGSVFVTANRGTFTTSQTGWLWVEHTMEPYHYDSEPVVVHLELGGSPVKDTLPPLVYIVQPDSGELWKTSDTIKILWYWCDNNNLISHIKMEYSKDSGANWEFPILDWTVECHSGWWYYLWGKTVNLPDIFSRNCLIKISATDFSGNSIVAISNKFTISNDTTPPPVPINITANGANPSPWQDSIRFIIDWTNPSDISGIAGAWCKLDSSPSYSGDGFYIDIKPFDMYVDTFIKTPRMLYVWLQDSSGNKAHLNRGSVELRYDATSPVAPESLFANGLNPSPWAKDSIFTIRYVEADSSTKSSELRVQSLEFGSKELSPGTYHLKADKGDTSGIVTALYKLGTLPTSNYDTTGITDTNPFNVVCTIECGETLWVWLKDGAGNINCNSRSSVILNYDITFPMIDSTTVLKDTVNFWGPFEVKAKITDNAPFNNPILFYRTSADTNWVIDTMTSLDVNWFMDSIPEFPHDSLVVDYYLTVEDSATNKTISGLYSFVIRHEVGIENKEVLIPKVFIFSQNHPNPFIGSTEIEYGLPKDTNVEIEVYNLLGQKVVTLVQGNRNAGYHRVRWNGKDNSDKKVAPGIYFYCLETNDFKATKKLTILK